MYDLINRLRDLPIQRTVLAIVLVALGIFGYMEMERRFAPDGLLRHLSSAQSASVPGQAANPTDTAADMPDAGAAGNVPGDSKSTYSLPGANMPMNASQPGAAIQDACPPGTLASPGTEGVILCVPTDATPGYGLPTSANYPPAAPADYPRTDAGWESGNGEHGETWIDNPRNVDAIVEAAERMERAGGTRAASAE